MRTSVTPQRLAGCFFRQVFPQCHASLTGLLFSFLDLTHAITANDANIQTPDNHDWGVATAIRVVQDAIAGAGSDLGPSRCVPLLSNASSGTSRSAYLFPVSPDLELLVLVAVANRTEQYRCVQASLVQRAGHKTYVTSGQRHARHRNGEGYLR